ncbi:MAG: hypothetical protein [Bacteriophage sp.]|nr:MAG: hypothetical protein [Bacteriophage sp.]
MKFKELFTTDNGIFGTVFSPDFPDEYQKIFGDALPKTLDVYAVMTFGNKLLSDSITADNYKDIVSSVITVNVAGWVKQAEAMTAEYDVLKPVTREVNRTETRTTDETSESENLMSDKVYNDTDFNQNNKENETGSKNKTETVTVSDIESGNGTNKNISENIQKEIELRKINFRKNIIFALLQEITISIYE